MATSFHVIIDLNQYYLENEVFFFYNFLGQIIVVFLLPSSTVFIEIILRFIYHCI